jgi:excisionase family DNA binding protein
MKNREYISVSELARFLGISRIAVYKRIKKGQINVIKIGKNFAVPSEYIKDIVGQNLSEKDKKIIDKAVEKTFKEYGEVIKKLGST